MLSTSDLNAMPKNTMSNTTNLSQAGLPHNTPILEPTKPLLSSRSKPIDLAPIDESNKSLPPLSEEVSCTESILLVLCPCTYLCQPTKFSRDCCNCCLLSDDIHIQPLIEIAGTWLSPKNPIPTWFICFRIFLMFLMISIVTFNFAIYAINDRIRYWFYYFTQWTNFFAMMLMIIKCISTPIIYNIIKINPNQLIMAQKKIWRLYVIHNILLHTVLPCITLVVINYWLFVYDPDIDAEKTGSETNNRASQYSSIAVHGVSAGILWIDFIISTEKMYYKSCIWSILFGTLYTIWTVIFEILELETHQGEKYIYEVFDWSEGLGNPLIFYFLSMAILILVTVAATFFKNWRLSKARIVSPIGNFMQTISTDPSMELSHSLFSSDNQKLKYTDTVSTIAGQNNRTLSDVIGRENDKDLNDIA